MKRYLFTTAMCTLAFLMAGPSVHAQVCEEPSVQSELQTCGVCLLISGAISRHMRNTSG